MPFIKGFLKYIISCTSLGKDVSGVLLDLWTEAHPPGLIEMHQTFREHLLSTNELPDSVLNTGFTEMNKMWCCHQGALKQGGVW